MNKLEINKDLQNKLNNIYSSRTTSKIESAPKNGNIPIAPPIVSETEVKKTTIKIPGGRSDAPDEIKNINPKDDENLNALLKFIVAEHISTYLELKEFKKNHEKEMAYFIKKRQEDENKKQDDQDKKIIENNENEEIEEDDN
ncbi:MAG: hypothetical protein Edafosvirus4_49 [Edafosvirus sp.]|uniref:Uncharacterized protein n=1 Tax=Edafosvirus sp. TaxID=2487765 RepID=A0A3G4ZT52_9VIRU|nr:MAG: hypothetical protein Edafosvirus4_49 [Edafosvirus sp.]